MSVKGSLGNYVMIGYRQIPSREIASYLIVDNLGKVNGLL